MQDRLNAIIKEKGLTATQFADSINVNPSTISHILTGRNKPGYDVLVNIALAFPDICMTWLLTGDGNMYNSTESSVRVEPAKNISTIKEKDSEKASNKSPSQELSAIISTECTEKKLKRIVLFFADGSFEDYK